MSLGEAIGQGAGAAARAGTILSRSAIDIEPIISHVDEERCDGCAYCVDPCPFHAITLIEYEVDGEMKKRVQVNEAVCKGCGVCEATCPKGAIFVWNFRPEQLLAEIHAALNVE
jgi:heterodisulfide reductase subunit A